MNHPRPPLVIAELSTARLVLRRLDPTLDSTDLFEIDAGPLVHRFVYGSSPSLAINQLQRRPAADLDQNGGTTWALRLRDDPTVLGKPPASRSSNRPKVGRGVAATCS